MTEVTDPLLPEPDIGWTPEEQEAADTKAMLETTLLETKVLARILLDNAGHLGNCNWPVTGNCTCGLSSARSIAKRYVPGDHDDWDAR